MTDRELLEDAAKAAGVALYWADDDPECDWVQGTYPRIPDYKVLEKWTWTVWNPLVDSGEALELAVTLGLRVHKTTSSVEIDIYKDGAWADTVEEKIEHDPLAATRRAIVRAAAEIERSKE